MTIYGSDGGVTSKRRHLHPGVLTLVISAGLIIAAALAYLALRSPASTPVASTGSPAASSAPAAAPATPAAPSPARQGLRTGTWLISPADAQDTYLTAAGEYAALSQVASTVTVIQGLADDSCFTFRNEDGDYLRHFDYRLRFDPKEDSDLFRKDATFCAEDDQTDGAFRVRSKNYPNYFLHRRDTKLYIDKPDGDNDDFTAGSTFVLQSPTNF